MPTDTTMKPFDQQVCRIDPNDFVTEADGPLPPGVTTAGWYWRGLGTQQWKGPFSCRCEAADAVTLARALLRRPLEATP